MAGKKGRSGRKKNPHRVDVVIHLRLDKLKDADILAKLASIKRGERAAWLKDVIRYGSANVRDAGYGPETKEMTEALDSLAFEEF